jgi:hypothetical protein
MNTVLLHDVVGVSVGVGSPALALWCADVTFALNVQGTGVRMTMRLFSSENIFPSAPVEVAKAGVALPSYTDIGQMSMFGVTSVEVSRVSHDGSTWVELTVKTRDGEQAFALFMAGKDFECADGVVAGQVAAAA